MRTRMCLLMLLALLASCVPANIPSASRNVVSVLSARPSRVEELPVYEYYGVALAAHVVSDGLFLRAAPGHDKRAIGLLEQMDTVYFVGGCQTVDGAPWARVLSMSFGEGWVNSQYLDAECMP